MVTRVRLGRVSGNEPKPKRKVDKVDKVKKEGDKGKREGARSKKVLRPKGTLIFPDDNWTASLLHGEARFR